MFNEFRQWWAENDVGEAIWTWVWIAIIGYAIYYYFDNKWSGFVHSWDGDISDSIYVGEYYTFDGCAETVKDFIYKNKWGTSDSVYVCGLNCKMEKREKWICEETRQ